MDFKYKISDVAKDFGISTKKVIDMVAEITGETKRPAVPLTSRSSTACWKS